MENNNETIRSFAKLGIKPNSTITEIRAAYLEKTSQKQFSKVFVTNEEIVNEFKRFHAAYVSIMRNYSETDDISDLSIYPPDQVFKLILNQGIYFMINHNYLKAGEKFQEAYSLNKKNEEVIVYLGILLLKRKNYYAAEKYFLEAIKINRDNDDTWVYLGDTYLKAEKKSKALTMFETAKRLNPQRSDIAEKIGLIITNKTENKQDSFLKRIINKFIK